MKTMTFALLLAATAIGTACNSNKNTAAAPSPAPSSPSETNPSIPAENNVPAETASATPAAAPLVVDLHHDIICPWCRIGHERLKRAITTFRAENPDRAVVVRYHPFLLEPSTPPEGFDLRERLASKYGATNLDAMFARVTSVGAEDGITFRFDKATRTPDTRPAHALVEAAPAAAREALLGALHKAYFEEGKNLGDTEVLVALWTALGHDEATARAVLTAPSMRDDILAKVNAARVPGMRGVPHFVIGDTTVGGAQAESVLVDALRKAAR